MSRVRTLALAGLAGILALALAACGGLPTSGPVNAGQPIGDDDVDSPLVFLPDGPSPDATPQQIVEGFIAAGSGPRGNWATAKEFLAPELHAEWNPRAGVIVDDTAARSLEAVADDEFVFTVTPVATVDDTGSLLTPSEDGEIALSFSLAQEGDGQWRITEAPDGIVLGRNVFPAVFDAYALQFFDPTLTYLVPDVRWFPQLYKATSIAEALVDGGPSPWLAGSVQTAFTDGARLAQVAVPVESGIAAVSLQEGARSLGSDVLDRMQTQLEASMATAGIDAVDMLVDEQLLAADSVDVRETTLDSRPLVRTDDDFGFLSGSSVEEIVGLSQALLQTDAVDIEVNATRSAATVRGADGLVSTVGSDGTTTVLDDRASLIAPSSDPAGYVFSVPSTEPSALVAFGPDGTRIEIAGAWTAASTILSQRVSRDGTRLAAVVRDGAGYAVWVAGIVRDRDGVPTSLGDPKLLSTLPGATRSLTWIDASTVAALTAQSGQPYLATQEVGGFAELQRAPADAVTVAGGAQSGGLQVRDAAGELYGQRGANWQHLAAGVSVLAIQQGAPR